MGIMLDAVTLPAPWTEETSSKDGDIRHARLRDGEGNIIEVTLAPRPDGISGMIVTDFAYHAVDGGKVRSTDLRLLPLEAIATAYASADLRAGILARRVNVLGDLAGSDPMTPLPRIPTTDLFRALLGRQYDAIAQRMPDVNPIGVIAEINGYPMSSAKRLVTEARRRGFLEPVAHGRRPKRKAGTA